MSHESAACVQHFQPRVQHIWMSHERPCFICFVVYLTSHTHTHTRSTAHCPGLPGWAGTRKVKPIWILLKQETVSGSGISWAVCKSAPRCRQITTPAPHHSVFLQAGCPSCRPTNSVKALKALFCCLYSWCNTHVIAQLASHRILPYVAMLLWDSWMGRR